MHCSVKIFRQTRNDRMFSLQYSLAESTYRQTTWFHCYMDHSGNSPIAFLIDNPIINWIKRRRTWNTSRFWVARQFFCCQNMDWSKPWIVMHSVEVWRGKVLLHHQAYSKGNQYLALHPWFAFLSHGYWDCCVKAIETSRAIGQGSRSGIRF